jgi:hypothetical protein
MTSSRNTHILILAMPLLRRPGRPGDGTRPPSWSGGQTGQVGARLTPVQAKTEEAMLTALAAKGVEADGTQQPIPLMPLPRPPGLLAPTS